MLNEKFVFIVGISISGEEFFEPVDEHLHSILTLQELDMGSAADQSVKVVVSDAEVNVDAVQHILRQVLQDVLRHADVDVSLSLIAISTVADLDASGVEGRV